MSRSRFAWMMGALLGVAVISTVAFMPMSNPARRGAPGYASADTAVNGDLVVVPRRGPIPEARARIEQVSLLCPYFNEEGDLNGCVLHDAPTRHAPAASVPHSVRIAERCGQTIDPRACDRSRIVQPSG